MFAWRRIFRFCRSKAHRSSRPVRSGRRRPGFTITELMVTSAAMVVVVLALGSAITEGVRGWQRMYEKVYSDISQDSFVARKAFDRVIRKASRQMYLVGDGGAWLEVYYYSSAGAAILDRYARFYVSSGELKVEHGSWTSGAENPKSLLSTETLCANVSSCVFKGDGRSAQMILTLSDESASITVVSSAVMHSG